MGISLEKLCLTKKLLLFEARTSCPRLALRGRELHISKRIRKGAVEKGHEAGLCKSSHVVCRTAALHRRKRTEEECLCGSGSEPPYTPDDIGCEPPRPAAGCEKVFGEILKV